MPPLSKIMFVIGLMCVAASLGSLFELDFIGFGIAGVALACFAVSYRTVFEYPRESNAKFFRDNTSSPRSDN